MGKKDEKILEAMKIMINEGNKKLEVDKHVQVSINAVSVVNGVNIYTISYHNQLIPNIKAIDNKIYTINDVCWALIPQNNFSFLIILGKIPS